MMTIKMMSDEYIWLTSLNAVWMKISFAVAYNFNQLIYAVCALPRRFRPLPYSPSDVYSCIVAIAIANFCQREWHSSIVEFSNTPSWPTAPGTYVFTIEVSQAYWIMTCNDFSTRLKGPVQGRIWEVALSREGNVRQCCAHPPNSTLLHLTPPYCIKPYITYQLAPP